VAERFVARLLVAHGWTILAANVRVGQDEIDLVATDTCRPRSLVFVEVRSNVTGRYGAPAESVVGGKLRRTSRAAWALLRAGALPDGTPLPRLRWRVDVVIVEHRPNLARHVGGPAVRHLRGVAPE
jgi:Holliday junction resolvase-like predicted endonuclease